MKRLAILFSLSGLCGVASALDASDLVLLHGKIHTQDAQRHVVEALAVRGHDIVAVGSDAAIRATIGPATQVVDLAGRVVLPGLIDAHTHPAMSAQDVEKCSLDDKLVTPRDVAVRVKACIARHPGRPRTWYEVVMVNPSGLTLTTADLDAVARDRPLMLTGSDGHTAWLNSAAMRLAKIDDATADPAGGHIIRDAAGRATGTLRDNATLLADAVKPPAPIADQVALLAKTLDAMRAVGITSVQDAAVDDHWMSLYKALYDQRRLNMRVRGSFHLRDLSKPPLLVVDDAKEFRDRWAIDPDYLRADAVKIFADGVIEYPSQTAALLTPYLDAAGRPTNNLGPSYFSQGALDDIVAGVDAAGMTVHVHAIGDRAVRSSLDAFAAARRRNGVLDNRDQIAHLELIDPQDFPRFKELGVIANFQLLWAQSDDYTTTAVDQYLGPTRAQYLYPARSLRDAGALLVGGSDWGVSSFDPFAAMEHAVTRAARRGAAQLLPSQAVSLADMVDAYTSNAAFALRQEATTGSLETGKRADLVILDRDIFVIDPYDLHTTKVLATYLDGRRVFAAQRPRKSQPEHR